MTNLYLIKLGKAWSALRKEGWGSFWDKSWGAVKNIARPIGKGEVLFIDGGVGDSALYRSIHVAEQLGLEGIKARVAFQDNPLIVGSYKNFKVFVFHRVLYTERIKQLIENIKEQQKEIIFEVDDLVFDAKFIKHMDSFKKMNEWERKLYEKGVGGEILTDPYVKVATTTTNFLARELAKHCEKVFVVKNKLSLGDWRDIEAVLKLEEEKAGKRRSVKTEIVLGYFSGTRSHDKDFATITEPLVRVLKERPNVKLLIAGPLELDAQLEVFGSRIERLPFVKRKKHWENIAGVDINLAPLEIGNPFCESKSELKFFEAGALKVPTVAAATQTFKEVINDGIDGYVAQNSEEWFNRLIDLLDSRGRRRDMGKKAQERVQKEYVNQKGLDGDYIDYLKKLITT